MSRGFPCSWNTYPCLTLRPGMVFWDVPSWWAGVLHRSFETNDGLVKGLNIKRAGRADTLWKRRASLLENHKRLLAAGRPLAVLKERESMSTVANSGGPEVGSDQRTQQQQGKPSPRLQEQQVRACRPSVCGLSWTSEERSSLPGEDRTTQEPCQGREGGGSAMRL